jgi:hypothetical protein
LLRFEIIEISTGFSVWFASFFSSKNNIDCSHLGLKNNLQGTYRPIVCGLGAYPLRSYIFFWGKVASINHHKSIKKQKDHL